ncbi:MAG: heparinase II/III family protein, partial [Undibacterium sp.]|nr:heparinase II/III family protein [Opitutaceae bacterium]
AALAAAKTDPLRASLHARIVSLAEAQLTAKPVEHVLIGPRLLDKSRTALSRVITGAMACRLTGDTRFAARAKLEMLTVSAFPDWNPSHFLDVAEMSTALALGYDWLYAYLTPAERTTIRTALLEKGIALAPVAYAGGKPTDKRVSFVTAHHNWNQVCNAGLLIAALALADEEPALARTVIAGARASLPLAMAAYAPDGAYPEGPGYWGYGTSYNVLALAVLENALGTDFDLGKAPAFNLTALYRLHIQSPMGLAFNYADGAATLGAAPEYTWLAARYPQPTALAHSRALLATTIATKKTDRESDRFFALHAVWFPSEIENRKSRIQNPLDIRFRGPAQLALFRSAWDDPRALFLGFKAGGNAVNHSHLDLGSFVLDADGVRWAQDLGPDGYNLPAYFGAQRWAYFRLNNFSHNTLTPGTALQAPKAEAPIVAFTTTPSRAYAVADLTAAYPTSAKKNPSRRRLPRPRPRAGARRSHHPRRQHPAHLAPRDRLKNQNPRRAPRRTHAIRQNPPRRNPRAHGRAIHLRLR